jgi:hypothetical protein
VTQYLLPIVLLAVPVLVVVGLAVLFGRRLSGSCGGASPDGSCSRCGKPAEALPDGARRGSCG